jgi:3-polyprenyl-4-hydroxybenzoate decarboxylase
VDSSVDRVLDLIGLPDEKTRRWNGPKRRNEIETQKGEE